MRYLRAATGVHFRIAFERRSGYGYMLPTPFAVQRGCMDVGHRQECPGSLRDTKGMADGSRTLWAALPLIRPAGGSGPAIQNNNLVRLVPRVRALPCCWRCLEWLKAGTDRIRKICQEICLQRTGENKKGRHLCRAPAPRLGAVRLPSGSLGVGVVLSLG